MIAASFSSALVNPVTQRPYVAPAIDLASATLTDAPDAYEAHPSAANHRPNRLIRTAAQMLSAPVAPAQLHEALVALTLCPITSEPLVNPVVAADGFTYSAAAITRWLGTSGTHARSPMTNVAMQDTSLIPNTAMRALMHDLGVVVDHSAIDEPVAETTGSESPATIEFPFFMPVAPTPVYNVAAYNFECEQFERVLRSLSRGVEGERYIWQRLNNSRKAQVSKASVRLLLLRAPNNMRAIRLLIDLYLVHDNIRHAKAWIDAAYITHPHNKDLLARRAFVHFSQGAYALGQADLETLRETIPSYHGRSVEDLVYRKALPWAATAAFGYVACHSGHREQGLDYLRVAQTQFTTRRVKHWLSRRGL